VGLGVSHAQLRPGISCRSALPFFVILSEAKNLCFIRPTAEENYFSGRSPKNQFSPAIATPTRSNVPSPALREDRFAMFSVLATIFLI
jgi:hypothetical protein